MHVIRKSYFQLLEVLVAVFLIVVCAMPVLHAYISMNQVQFENARIYERDHLVHLVHAKIVEGLYRKKIPLAEIQATKSGSWKELASMLDDEDRDQLASYTANQFDKLFYDCTYTLKFDKPNSIKSNTVNLLMGLTIQVKDLMKHPENEKDSSQEVVYHYSIYGKIES